MKLLTYWQAEQLKLGIKRSTEGILPAPLSPAELYAGGVEAVAMLNGWQENQSSNDVLLESDLKLGPAIPSPGKILCVGLNYSRHAAESGLPEPEYPVLFSKFNNAVAAHNEEVPVSAMWTTVDYEAELAVVIGKQAHYVSEAKALDCVLGYTNANDLSERNLQFRSGQWLLGKSLDKFLPLGPYLVTADEIAGPQNLRVQGWLNGELRQSSSTADMIFSVAEIIAYASQFMTLEPGDVITTGTPEGVVLGRQEKVYLQPGDVYTIEIEGLGQLSNKIVEEIQ